MVLTLMTCQYHKATHGVNFLTEGVRYEENLNETSKIASLITTLTIQKSFLLIEHQKCIRPFFILLVNG